METIKLVAMVVVVILFAPTMCRIVAALASDEDLTK